MTSLKTIFCIAGSGLLPSLLLGGCGNGKGSDVLYYYAKEAHETGEGYRMVDSDKVFCEVEMDGHTELVETETHRFLKSSQGEPGLAVNADSHRCYLVTGTKKGVLGFEMIDPYGFYKKGP